MTEVLLRRYVLNTNEESGWAIIVLGSDGFFAAVSDHGNYSYIWTHPGCEFRRFLTELNPDYFHGKIMQWRDADVWDQQAVEKNIKERLAEMVADGVMSQEAADLAFDEAESCDIQNYDGLVAWAYDQNLPETFTVYEGIAATMPEPQSWMFVTKVLPRLQKLLREELEKEKT